jgi:hypothetical protein
MSIFMYLQPPPRPRERGGRGGRERQTDGVCVCVCERETEREREREREREGENERESSCTITVWPLHTVHTHAGRHACGISRRVHSCTAHIQARGCTHAPHIYSVSLCVYTIHMHIHTYRISCLAPLPSLPEPASEPPKT